MKRLVRFSTRGLLLFVLVSALSIWVYRTYFVVHMTQCNVAVAVFGNTKYDRAKAHSDLVSQLDPNSFLAIEKPVWADGLPISESTEWRPTRNDWFLVLRGGCKLYVHVASDKDALAVDIWNHRRIMHYERADFAFSTKEAVISSTIGGQFNADWIDWCIDNQPIVATPRST